VFRSARKRRSDFAGAFPARFGCSPESRRNRSLKKMPKNRIWKVSLRSQKGQHRFKAEKVNDADGKLVFTDAQGNLTGSYCSGDVQGYSSQERPDN
jgi:hypothetical protein